MKPPKFKSLVEVEKNMQTQGSTSSNFPTGKNKKAFYQTRSTNFSLEQIHDNNNFTNKKFANNKERKIRNTKLRKNESTTIGLKKPIISISTPDRAEAKKMESPIKINSLVPTNVNSFLHLIQGNEYGVFENINWALGLRGSSYMKNARNEYSRDKISLTEVFNEPTFYANDLEKYKKKQNYRDSKIIKYNPNYNKIKHLILGKTTGNKNYSQFQFSSCLRDYNSKEKMLNIEKEKKWKVMPLPKLKNDIYKVKCLSPVTQKGIENYHKLEKYMPKNYDITYRQAVVGNDRIKVKELVNNRSYTVCGYGDSLGDIKYNNKFGDNNMFANKKLLRVSTNPLSKFELGLRIYDSHKNLGHHIK